MSNNSSKKAQKTDNIESNISKENNIDTDEQNEENEVSEEIEDDKTSKNENIDKNIPINYNEQTSIEGIKNIKKKKKKIKDVNKHIENENIIENNKEIIKQQDNLKINEEKDKKIKEYEEKIKKLEQRLLIFDEKDKTVQKLTKINLKLKNSLELASKKIDEKIHNIKIIRNKNNNNSNKSMNNLTYDITKKNEFNKKNNDELLLKEKELNNAMNMIKILKFDKQRLQKKLDEIEQNKEIEKEIKDKKQILIQNELQEHKICKQKIENYQETIRKLTEKNKNLMDKIIYGKNKKGSNTHLNNNNYNESSESDDDNEVKLNKLRKQFNGSDSSQKLIKGNLFNIKKLSTTRKFNNSLPKINYRTNQQVNTNNIKNTIININNIFNSEEILQLNKIFFKNTNAYNIILKKLEILQKSKDSLDNKYKLEQKQFNKRIYSMQQQIEYLNTKIREGEIKLNILQAQLNESKIENKQLLKRIKILTEGFEFNAYAENFNNKNENQSNKKKKNNKIKLKKNKNQHENSIDSLEIKGQKINNSIEVGNEGESISGENFFEETNKNIKLNKDNDNSEKNYIYSND